MDQFNVWYHKTKYLTLEQLELRTYQLQKDQPLLPHPEAGGLSLVSITGGSATVLTEDSRYNASAGDIFLFHEREPACIPAVLTESFRWRIITFDPGFISPNGQCGFDARYLRAFYDRTALFTHKISHDHPACADMNELLQKLENEVIDGGEDSPWRVKSLLLQILLDALDYYRGDSSLNPSQLRPVPQSNETIETIIDYIDENLSQPLSLSLFAEIAHMNPFYFSTYFKKYTTMSPSQYVLRSRVNQAKKLLAETDRTILDIACYCGFNSTANFNKAFKKATGKTPSEYREQLKYG